MPIVEAVITNIKACNNKAAITYLHVCTPIVSNGSSIIANATKKTCLKKSILENKPLYTNN